MKYKWILFGVGPVVAVVLCWVFGVFIWSAMNLYLPNEFQMEFLAVLSALESPERQSVQPPCP